MIISLRPHTERYSGIADRWPAQITISGSPKQCKHFIEEGIYEAGCDDLLVAADALSETLMEELEAL